MDMEELLEQPEAVQTPAEPKTAEELMAEYRFERDKETITTLKSIDKKLGDIASLLSDIRKNTSFRISPS